MEPNPPAMRQLKKGYPLKVWMTTLLGGAVLLSYLIFQGSGIPGNQLSAIVVIIVVSIILSLPAFLINRLLCHSIAAGNLETKLAKGIIALIGICLIGITFCIIIVLYVSAENDTFLYLPLCYTISSVIATFCFQLREPDTL